MKHVFSRTDSEDLKIPDQKQLWLIRQPSYKFHFTFFKCSKNYCYNLYNYNNNMRQVYKHLASASDFFLQPLGLKQIYALCWSLLFEK
jgi:hypothetical protein